MTARGMARGMARAEPAGLDRRQAEEAFERAVTRYFAERHARVEPFVDRHFGLRGSLSLHRAALGWDILRAPANLMLTGPTLALKVAAAGARAIGARRLGRWLDTRDLFLRTEVGRRLDALIWTELLELPIVEGGRATGRDAFAEAFLETPAVDAVLATYLGTRAAASEVSTALVSVAAGAGLFKQLTPGMMSLGPSLAAMLAHQSAVAGFPLGASLGALWYAAFPATASPALVAGTTAALGLAGATLAAFAGILADPVQRRLGQHQRRLHRLLDALEANVRGRSDAGLKVRDHYLAKLMDLLDYMAAAARMTGG